MKKVFYTDEVETHALAGIPGDSAGQVYLHLGPSGCGKSTLLSILGLLDTPTDGTYVLNDRSVADLPLAERARVRNREIGFIFQSFNLIGDLAGTRTSAAADLSRHESCRTRKRAMAALEKVEMSHRASISRASSRRSAAARRGCPRRGRLAVHSCSPTSHRQPDPRTARR